MARTSSSQNTKSSSPSSRDFISTETSGGSWTSPAPAAKPKESRPAVRPPEYPDPSEEEEGDRYDARKGQPGALMGGSTPVSPGSMKGKALLGRKNNLKAKTAFKKGPVACKES